MNNSYVINTCLLNIKCTECTHHRPDPERDGECSCYLNEDLQGQERLEYLKKLYETFTKNSLQTN